MEIFIITITHKSVSVTFIIRMAIITITHKEYPVRIFFSCHEIYWTENGVEQIILFLNHDLDNQAIAP